MNWRFTLLIAATVMLLTQPALARPKYKITEVVHAETKLTGASTVAIAVPQDGQYGGKTYKGSGQAAADATRAAFAQHLQKADIVSGTAGQGVEQARAAAASAGYGYYCQLEILQWVDRATEWSGKRDTIEVKLSVYDTATGTLIYSAIVQGYSKFWTFGGDHPQDLAFAHMHVLVDKLF